MALEPKSVRHLVFDLDDTLFDTLGLLVAPAIKEACQAMIKAGLNATVEECLAEREKILKGGKRQNIFASLVSSFGCAKGKNKDEIVKAGFIAFHDRKITEKIYLFNDAVEVLTKLKKTFKLYLLTMGTPSTQAAKIQILGLKPYFDKIIYVDVFNETSKERAFRSLMRETGDMTPAHWVSIGNRIDSEIRDAKALGIQTVLIKQGEYTHLVPQDKLETPDVTIARLSEILTLLPLDA